MTRSAQTVGDLRQQSIAVLEGSDTIAVVRSRLPQARLVGVDSYEAARMLLEANQVSAFAADATVLTGWVQEFPQYDLLPPLSLDRRIGSRNAPRIAVRRFATAGEWGDRQLAS